MLSKIPNLDEENEAESDSQETEGDRGLDSRCVGGGLGSDGAGAGGAATRGGVAASGGGSSCGGGVNSSAWSKVCGCGFGKGLVVGERARGVGCGAIYLVRTLPSLNYRS